MKRKVILYLAMSLDGYIADRDGGVDWLEEVAGDYDGYKVFVDGIDTVIMGMKTYHQIVTELSPDKWDYQGKQCYVFTHQTMAENENVQFVSGQILPFMDQLKAEAGKDIWICGGGDIIHQLIQADLIDEYHLTILPIILGDGIPLFRPGRPRKLLQIQKVEAANGILDVVYAPKVN